jgi:hypothetical protein
MGKATELDNYLETRPLTPVEIIERQAAAKSGGEGEATADGQLVKRPTPAAAPIVTLEAPRQTWD